MKIKITKTTTVRDFGEVEAGKTVDAPEPDASYLVSIGKAEFVGKEKKKTKGMTTETAGAIKAGLKKK